jgi:hypothetical protein
MPDRLLYLPSPVALLPAVVIGCLLDTNSR